MLHNKRTIVVVDDHPIVLEGMVKLLNGDPAYTVSGSFTNGNGLLDFLQNNRPDMVLLDIGLPDINGMELFGRIRALSPETIILAFSNHSEYSAVMQMLNMGANGYILKSTMPQQIIGCISAAFEGRLALSPEVEAIVEMQQQVTEHVPSVRLSAREKEILTMIASGITSSDIAKTLFLSKFTVENHRKNLLQKLGVKNVAELIAEAVRRQLI